MYSRFIFTVSFILISLSANAQFGIRTSYNINSAAKWNTFFSGLDARNDDIFSTSVSLTLDYWLRLPNHRIEFYPNISYHQANTTIIGNAVDLSLRQMGAGIIAHVYILDLVDDCDCPTFSKQSGFVKKGIFVLAGIGGDYAQKAIDDSSFDDGNLDFKASLGMGIDLGISDLITVTPFVQFQYHPAISWHEVGVPFGEGSGNVETSLSQIQIGARLGFRTDYK